MRARAYLLVSLAVLLLAFGLLWRKRPDPVSACAALPGTKERWACYAKALPFPGPTEAEAKRAARRCRGAPYECAEVLGRKLALLRDPRTAREACGVLPRLARAYCLRPLGSGEN